MGLITTHRNRAAGKTVPLAPLGLPEFTTATLPAASQWRGHIAYIGGSAGITYSDGSSWIDLPLISGGSMDSLYDLLFQLQVVDSLYDAANNRIVISGFIAPGGSPNLGSPGETEYTHWILISEDGAATFTMTQVSADGIDQRWRLFNNVNDSEYVAIVSRSTAGPLVYTAAHTAPETWTLRDTVTEVINANDRIDYVAYDGDNTFVGLSFDNVGDRNDLYFLRSTDAGANWTYQDYDEQSVFLVGSPLFFGSPQTANTANYSWFGIVYDGSHFIAGVRAFDQLSAATWSASSPTGVTWTSSLLITEPNTIDSGFRLATDGNGSAIILGVNADQPAILVHRSTDNGSNWDENSSAIDDDILVIFSNVIYDTQNSRYVFAAVDSFGPFDRIYSSNATGTAWTLEATSTISSEPVTIAHVSGSPNFYIMGGFGLATIDADFTEFTYIPPL